MASGEPGHDDKDEQAPAAAVEAQASTAGPDAEPADEDDADEIAPPAESHEPLPPPPPEVAELARACVEFVKKSTTMELDYTAETLPILDHYLRAAREESMGKPELWALIAPAAGCYLGEVTRRRVRARWHAPPGEHRRFRLELVDVFLSTNPIGAAVEALLLEDAPDWGARFRMRKEDEAVAEHALANMPEVDVEDYYAPSSRLEILEIVTDALIGAQLSQLAQQGPGAEAPRFGETDYGWVRAEAIAEAEGKGRGLA